MPPTNDQFENSYELGPTSPSRNGFDVADIFTVSHLDCESSSDVKSFNPSKYSKRHSVREAVIPVQLHTGNDDHEHDAHFDTRLDSIGSGSSSISAAAANGQTDFPDGGLRAWLVVLGTAFSTLASFGYINSWGVFQSYYEQTLLKDHSPSSIAWIGSLQICLVFLPALFSGRLFDLGIFKFPFMVASAVLVVSTFLVAQCTQYWQFVLCQGLATGLGVGMIFGPSLSILGHWFKQKRGIAMGLTTFGSSVGGTFFPIATRRLIPVIGFPWTMRILAFILLFALCIPCLTLARRLPPKAASGGLFNFRLFTDSPPFSIYSGATVCMFLGLFTVLTYIDISAVTYGVSSEHSFYLVAIANASSAVGRLVTGFVVDKSGAINFIAPTTFLTGIITFVWPFTKSVSSLTAIAVLYGFLSGTIVSGFLIPAFLLGEVEDIGRRTGMIMTMGAIGGLFGTPISGAINRVTGGFVHVGYFAGSMIILSGTLMLVTRHFVLRKLWGKF
ncbi:MFS general substrate transporter [Rhodocollybia butyracea]|uniref:MFS general substrate transporter n=1 Tax=Rhodocollybia butyracea TaxID=206335 RepID=A0A9P5Q8V4_9AGAR|nr:MFS general substrate transporter [Rhodocollybia butyracea]